MEIGLVPVVNRGQYPGLYLITGPARMVRPVLNLHTNSTEMIGSFEQVQNHLISSFIYTFIFYEVLHYNILFAGLHEYSSSS